MVQLDQAAMIEHGVKDTAYVSVRHKFIWVQVPKSASSSCEKIINSNITHNIVPVGPSSKVAMLKYPDYNSFTFVRNPWDRVVSCYCDRVQRLRFYDYDVNAYDPKGFKDMGLNSGVSFNKFVSIICDQDDDNSDYHWRAQHSFITIDDKVLVKFIGKVETFTEDWEKLFELLNWNIKKVFHMNKSVAEVRKHRSYKNYYNSTTKALVAKRFEKDIDTFKYTY